MGYARDKGVTRAVDDALTKGRMFAPPPCLGESGVQAGVRFYDPLMLVSQTLKQGFDWRMGVERGMVPRMPPYLRAVCRLLLLLGGLGGLAYVAFCAMVVWNKESILYPSPGRERAAGGTPPEGVEIWWRELPDGGGRVEAWWRPAEGAAPGSPAPAVMYFHGNGELIDDQWPLVELWHRLGVSVLLCEHVGYGRSAGRPALEADIANVAAWYDVLVARPEVRSDAILAHGFSLGASFAAQLAARRPVAGLVLESTFSSLPSMARRLRVWLYFGGERMDTAAVLRGLDARVPVLITHGRLDLVIPVEEGRRLAAARPAARYVEGDYPHIPWAQDEPDQVLLRKLLDAALPRVTPDGAARWHQRSGDFRAWRPDTKKEAKIATS